MVESHILASLKPTRFVIRSKPVDRKAVSWKIHAVMLLLSVMHLMLLSYLCPPLFFADVKQLLVFTY